MDEANDAWAAYLSVNPGRNTLVGRDAFLAGWFAHLNKDYRPRYMGQAIEEDAD